VLAEPVVQLDPDGAREHRRAVVRRLASNQIGVDEAEQMLSEGLR
jgi:hypothetical protein